MDLVLALPALPATARVSRRPPNTDGALGAWLEATVPGLVSRSRRRQHVRAATSRGWPCELSVHELDAQLVVVAIYGFFDLDAAVVIASLDDAYLLAHEAALADALLAAEPDWRPSSPLAISELWTAPVESS